MCWGTQIEGKLKLDYFHYFHLCFVGPPQAKDTFDDDYGDDTDDDTDDDNDDDEDR